MTGWSNAVRLNYANVFFFFFFLQYIYRLPICFSVLSWKLVKIHPLISCIFILER